VSAVLLGVGLVTLVLGAAVAGIRAVGRWSHRKVQGYLAEAEHYQLVALVAVPGDRQLEQPDPPRHVVILDLRDNA
jgi:hypothetical protein